MAFASFAPPPHLLVSSCSPLLKIRKFPSSLIFKTRNFRACVGVDVHITTRGVSRCLKNVLVETIVANVRPEEEIAEGGAGGDGEVGSIRSLRTYLSSHSIKTTNVCGCYSPPPPPTSPLPQTPPQGTFNTCPRTIYRAILNACFRSPLGGQLTAAAAYQDREL